MSVLKKGMEGAPVARLQTALGIEADGIFGSGTEKALRDAQSSHGLSVDGIAGPDTFMALGLNELVLLRVGTRGSTVKKLQEALGIDSDGKFGTGTKKAVQEFQKSQGLDPDGLAGPETLALLEQFSTFTDATVAMAAVQPGEEKFKGEAMPEIDGATVVAGSEIDVPENKSVWGKVKGWFS